jgi:hypothetical protein
MPQQFNSTSRKILGEHAKIWMPKPMREVNQRWDLNGRASKNILEGFNIVNQDGVCFWVLLLRELQSQAEGWLVDRIGKTITLFFKEELIANLWLEYKSGLFFEVHYQFHATSGELCSCSGFRTLELTTEVIDHAFPYIQGAKEDPASKFPGTRNLRLPEPADGECKQVRRPR